MLTGCNMSLQVPNLRRLVDMLGDNEILAKQSNIGLLRLVMQSA